MGGRRFQRLGPSPTLGSLGPSFQWRHKSQVSLWGPPCVHGALGILHGEVCDYLDIELVNIAQIFSYRLGDDFNEKTYDEQHDDTIDAQDIKVLKKCPK